MNRLYKTVLTLLLTACFSHGWAQVLTFGNDPQHTSLYTQAAQPLQKLKWTTQINENLTGGFAHYGSPLVTGGNTVIIPIRTASNGYDLVALDGATGIQKYRLSTGYTQPPAVSWLVPVQPVVATDAFGTHLYYPGAGGTIWKLDDPDAAVPAAPTRIVFYGTSATYLGNQSAFDAALNVNTPLTADAQGNVFFGIRTTGTAPAPLSTTSGFVVRVTPTGTATYVSTVDLTGDAIVQRISHGSAPALTPAGDVLYVVLKGNNSVTSPLLAAVDANSLALINKVALNDPRNGQPASVTDVSTASPMVAPDGDVYIGVQGNPYNGSRGFLLRFNAALTVQKTPGGFGWDYTPAVIPASMVPSYTGTSSYLLFCKYNNYAITDGDGVNTVAVLDPNETEVDFHSSAPGLALMRQVLTLISPTPDEEYPTRLGAAREWCINAAAVSVPNNSVYFNCEDGHLYRWDLSQNSLSEAFQLNSGVGQPYVPTVITADGTLITLNGGYVFAIGADSAVQMSLTSSRPDVREGTGTDLVTLSSRLSGTLGTPSGTVRFEDITVVNFIPTTTVLATVPLDANGEASFTTSLDGGAVALGSHYGNHRVTAYYSGDGTYPPSSKRLAQKSHLFVSASSVVAGGTLAYPDPVTLNATVSNVGGGTEVPSGYLNFALGGGSLAQLPLNGAGQAGTSRTLLPGQYTVQVQYGADTFFAGSTGDTTFAVTDTTSTGLVVSAASSDYGQPVTFTATLAPGHVGAGVPAGSVTFSDGSTVLGVVAVDGSGSAALTLGDLGVGSHAVTATFAGEPGWLASASSPATHDVGAATSLSGSSTPVASSFGTVVTLHAFVAPTTSGAGVPAGSVTFAEGATILGTATVDGSGLASLTASGLTVGAHSFSATFAGTGGWGSSSSSFGHEVTAETTTTLASNPNPSTFGQEVLLTATVSGGAAGTPSGSVTFTEGATTLGTATLDASGLATLTVSSLGVGIRSITADFLGTGGFLASQATSSQTVNAPTTTSVVSAPNPSAEGQAVTFTVTVASGGAPGVPTGSVTLSGPGVSQSSPVGPTGQATFVVGTLALGSHTLTADFTGTNNWLGSAGTVVQVVTGDTQPPSVPTGLTAVSGPNRGQIRLAWSPSVDPQGSTVRYRIYRSSSAGGRFSLLTTVSTTTYTDKPGRGKRRWYYLRAVDGAGNVSAPSVTVNATGK